jgi:hypothetical protein
MRLSGAEEGSLMLLLPTPVRSLYTQGTAQKAYKAQEVLPRGSHESRWPSLMAEVGVLVEERRGNREWCLRCSRPSAR